MVDELQTSVTMDASDFNRGVREVLRGEQDLQTSNQTTGRSFTELNQAAELAGKVIGQLAGAFPRLIGVLKEAQVIKGVERGFESLQESVGRVSTESFAQLQTATKGLVGDLDLMRSANNAVLLGVDDGSGKFAELAAAAVKLGQAVGRNATESINDLTVGVGRQSKLILDNLGVIVDAEKAYKDYAAANNLVAESLTDVQRKAAFQAAAFESITRKALALQQVQEDAGTAAIRLSNSFESARNEFIKGISDSDSLRDALNSITRSLKEIDFRELGEKFGSFISYLIESVSLAKDIFLETFATIGESFDTLLNALVGETAAANSKGFFRNLFDFNDPNLQNGLIVADKLLKQVTQGTFSYSDAIAQASQEVQELNNIQADLARGQERLDQNNERLKIEFPELFQKTTIASQETEQSIVKVNTQVSTLSKNVDSLINRDLDRLFEDKPDLFGFELDLDRIQNIESELDNLFEGQKGKDLFGLGDDDRSITERLGRAFAEAIGGPEVSDAFANAGTEIVSGLGQQFSSLISLAINGGNTGSFGSAVGGIGGTIGGGILGALSFSNPAFAVAGTLLGSQIGGQIGEAIGGPVFESIKGLFGGDDAQTAARKEADKFFVDLFDPNRIRLVVGDQVAILDDLIFNDVLGGQKAYDGIEQLDSAFLGLGETINSAFDLGLEEGQLGAVLGNNLESLNNLQLALQASGVSAEQLGQALEDAYFRGEISAKDFLSQSAQVQDLYTQGIPGAIGATDQAYQNLVKGGLQSGQIALDAFGDIAAEALEAQIDTIPELIDSYRQQGKAVEDLDALYGAFASQNIDSLEDLKNISLEQSAALVSALQDTGFGFEQRIEEARTLSEVLTEIDGRKVSIDVEYRVRTTGDAPPPGAGSTLGQIGLG